MMQHSFTQFYTVKTDSEQENLSSSDCVSEIENSKVMSCTVLYDIALKPAKLGQ